MYVCDFVLFFFLFLSLCSVVHYARDCSCITCSEIHCVIIHNYALGLI